jgi:phosphoglycolate phosphatase-like HAD superfamily hydrolase
MTGILNAVSTEESEEEIRDIVRDFVERLTGEQTVYQMIRLAEEVEKRNATPKDPLVYKHEFNMLLLERIEYRRESLRSGRITPDSMIVSFALEMLESLKEKGVELYLASGTDMGYVLEEAGLLGLEKYFGSNIFGSLDNYESFSKKKLIEQILSENKIDGSRLAVFGDGFVEIENSKSAGGTAIAVASDETGKTGKADPWKRERLINAGADIVIPDYRDYKMLIKYLWNEN